MKIIVMISATMLVFTACRKDEVVCAEVGKGDVIVTYNNMTDRNLNSFTAGGCFPMDLNVNKQSCPVSYPQLCFDGILVDEDCTAEVDKAKMESFNQFYFCGTEKHTVESGVFEVNIVIAEMDGEEYLKLDLK